MSGSSVRRVISRNVRFLVNETKRRNSPLTLHWNNNRSFASSETDGNDEKNNENNKKSGDESKLSESMDAFIKLEVQLRQKRKAREILENKDATFNDKQEKRTFRVTTKPEEPNPLECCGNDCANCVWIDYAEMMVEYEEYVKAGKPPQ